MEESYFYWAIYKNLEGETLALAKQISFSTKQKGVYSMAIADLIIRCAVEIEALSKKLYESLGGDMNPVDLSGNKRPLYYDTDCLALIDEMYKISKKAVVLSSPYFSFDDNVIYPLKKAGKRGTSGSSWNRAYQALKHNKYDSLKKWGTVENLVDAIGALYLLNVYFRGIDYPVRGEFKSFDARLDSDIFSVLAFNATNTRFSSTMDDRSINNMNEDELDRSTYIVKYTDKSLNDLQQAFIKDNGETTKRMLESPEMKKYINEQEGPIDATSFKEGLQNLRATGAAVRYVTLNSVIRQYGRAEKEAILNKHQKSIYANPEGDSRQ